MRPVRSLRGRILPRQREGILGSPNLASERACAVVWVQPVYGSAVGDREDEPRLFLQSLS